MDARPTGDEENAGMPRQSLGRRAEVLVMSCHRNKAFDFIKAFKNQGEFSFVNKQMNHIMDSFHLANHTLILLGSSDPIFMAVLDTLIADGACKRLPQDEKKLLLKSMNRLPDSDNNMSTEKKKMLELIRRDLITEGSNQRQCVISVYNQNDGVLIQEVEDLANAIVLEAEEVSHNKLEEVQRVAQLSRKVLYLLPQSAMMLMTTPHQETMEKQVAELKDDLKGVLDVIRQPKPVHRRAPALMITSYNFLRQQAKRTAELANSIEQCYNTLAFMVVHHQITNIDLMHAGRP